MSQLRSFGTFTFPTEKADTKNFGTCMKNHPNVQLYATCAAKECR